MHQRKLNTVPSSISSHLGATRVPVYLVIPGEVCCEESSDIKPEVCRISWSSRTLVPCRTMGLN